MPDVLPQASSPFGTTPVFDCHVLMRRPSGDETRWQARCAAAPSVTATGPTERETLQAIVVRFKYFLHEHHSGGQPIPWVEPPLSPDVGEVERWISVHL